MKKINIAIQVGPSEDIEDVLAYCAERGIRSYSVRAMLAALGRFLGRVAMRLTDIVVSLSLLLTLFPLLYVVLAVVVKRRSPGPAIVVEPARLADGRRCGLFTFRMPEEGEPSMIARAPRLINILLGQLSLFGKAPTPIEPPVEIVPPVELVEVPGIREAEVAGEPSEVKDEPSDENLELITNTENENNVILE